MDQHERDIQFLQIVKQISRMSKCSSRQVGAVLVREGSIISQGYNGAPRGCTLCQDREQPCRRRVLGYGSGEGLELCPAQHAEGNAIIQAARNGVATSGATLYAWCCRPCQKCAGAIVNAGVVRVVHVDLPAYDEMSGQILREGGVQVDKVSAEECGWE